MSTKVCMHNVDDEDGGNDEGDTNNFEVIAYRS